MSDKFISELDRVKYLFRGDLIPISQGLENKEYKAYSYQLFGDDTNWQNFSLNSYYRHPDPANFPKYRKVGNVTYLSGTLFIPFVFGNLTQNFQSVKVDQNSVVVSSGSLYFLSNGDESSCIRYDAAPEQSIFFRNIILTRRYVVDQINDDPTDDFSFPLSAVVTLEITPWGSIVIHSLSATLFDYNKEINAINYFGFFYNGSHPFSQLSSILQKDSNFPSFNQVNIGLSTENNAITIPPFNETILVPEDIDTTKASDLGGFRIDLSGLHFVNSRTKKYPKYYSRS